MFPDYERLILEDYLQKRTQNKLPLAMTIPTPARLKEECERVCAERFERKDEPVIRGFFGTSGDQKACLKAIRDSNIDRFRPLVRYLKTGGLTNPEPENIELLAWLIDFQDRPYVLGKRYITAVAPGSKITIALPVGAYAAGSVVENPEPIERGNAFEETTNVETPENSGNETAETVPVPREIDSALQILPRWRYWNAFVAGTLLLVAGMAGFWSLDGREPSIWAGTNGSCMYWADDHYQPIPCNQKMPNKRLVALDTALVKNFRKITQPDTITYRAKGWVWYSKINNRVEFFTSDGEHPVVYGRPLRPITDYMIDKYIKQGMTSNP